MSPGASTATPAAIGHWLGVIDKTLAQAGTTDETLLNGRLGGALYYYHAYQAGGKATDYEQAEAIICGAIQHFNLGSHYREMSFGSGAAGLFALVEYVQRQQPTTWLGAEDLQHVSHLLYSQAQRWLVAGRVDNLYGAGGLLHYLAQTAESPTAYARLGDLVELLAQQASPNAAGAILPNVLLHNSLEVADVGLAHGLTGLLLILLRIHAKGVATPGLRPLIDGLLHVVADAMQVPAPEADCCSLFPMLLTGHARHKTLSNRLAWCYGDITQALLFQAAGRVLQEPRWLALAQQIGHACVPRRSQAQTLVQDASFCHGAAGLAQLYLSLYQATQDSTYQAEHQYWLGETLRLLEADFARHHYQGREWSLLDGLPGIGLVLLASLFPSATSWTTLLLLD